MKDFEMKQEILRLLEKMNDYLFSYRFFLSRQEYDIFSRHIKYHYTILQWNEYSHNEKYLSQIVNTLNNNWDRLKYLVLVNKTLRDNKKIEFIDLNLIETNKKFNWKIDLINQKKLLC